ncbi:MAG: hypothetical protein J6T54_10150 [Fibrobacter sp.]|nr:hypothetical protein [Fibrobacter sp.]
MKGSDIQLENTKKALLGRVSLEKSGANGLARAGIAYDVSNSDGSPADLSLGNDGLCIAYQSDFDVEVRLDTEDYASSSVDKDVPYVSLSIKDGGNESHCASWKDFRTKDSDDKDGSKFATKVRSVQLVFVGASGSSGEFSIQRLTPYVRSDLWFGKSDGAHVKTGFAKGDEGTSGQLTFFEDSSEAYFEWGYSHDDMELDEKIENNEGFYGNVVFEGSSSNPDVGFEFLVAGKTTKNDKDFIYTANVSSLWKGMCLEYDSQMDIVMELVPGDSSAGTLENDVKTMTFAKNYDMEKNCVVFADVLDGSDDILKHLAKIRVKFAKENKAGTAVEIRRISALVPENLSVKESGELKVVTPTQSSDHKSGKSFLWDGSVDGDHVDLGISGATAGGIWTNSPEETDRYTFGFPKNLKTDDNGYVIASLVSKYHKFTGYVKSDEDDNNIATISLNTVSSNLEPADISAWNGFCIHYEADSEIRITIVTDSAAHKYWYAEVPYSDDMVWGKVSWDAFQNIDEESDEKIEDVIGVVSQVQLRFPYDGGFTVDKFGSYDQCGK